MLIFDQDSDLHKAMRKRRESLQKRRERGRGGGKERDNEKMR